MQSNYSTAKGASTHRKRYRNKGFTGHDNPLHRPGGGASKAGLDQTFSQAAASGRSSCPGRRRPPYRLPLAAPPSTVGPSTPAPAWT